MKTDGWEKVVDMEYHKAEIKKRDARIAELEKALAKMGDASTDVFDQMIKGSWADSEGHDVRLNVAMLYLKSAVVTAMEILWPLSKRTLKRAGRLKHE